MNLRKWEEILKLKWFQKPIIDLSSNSDQTMDLTENDVGTLTQEDIVMVSNLKFGTCLRSIKSWRNKSKIPFK